jgi:glycosyltransferase involved in cell wall biosynthesis
MHVVINAALLLSPLTGMGNFVYHAARALLDGDKVNRYTFYYGWFSDRLIGPESPAGDGRPKRFAALRRAKALLDRHPAVRGLARSIAHGYHRVASRSRRFDLYYEPNYIPVDIPSRRVVATVHDLSFHVHPEWHPKDRVTYFARHFLDRAGRADVVTTDSEFTRRELLDLLRADASRVRVVYPGCDHALFRPRESAGVERFRRAHGLPERFVLFVGSIEPRKNIDRLLDAWAQLPPPLRRDFRLVLAGFPGRRNKPVLRRIAGMKDDASFLGYLDADSLALCYNAASLFVYPSLYEGFGLPPLEAMASGCPVVASDIEPLHEVCGGAALFADPLKSESLAGRIEQALTDEGIRKALSEKGLARAEGFTWDVTARGLLKAFDDAAGG